MTSEYLDECGNPLSEAEIDAKRLHRIAETLRVNGSFSWDAELLEAIAIDYKTTFSLLRDAYEMLVSLEETLISQRPDMTSSLHGWLHDVYELYDWPSSMWFGDDME